MDFQEEIQSYTVGQVRVIKLSRPKVNALSSHLRELIIEELRDAIAASEVNAIVITSDQSLPFSAGADIKEFTTPEKLKNDGSLDTFTDFFREVQSSSKAVVAAISRYALGGGLEIALACHYRVAVGRVKLALPEVNIGVLPGGGGTQLLPRRVGLPMAVDMICTGKPVSGAEALKMGLLDAYDTHHQDAEQFALEWLANHPDQRKNPLAIVSDPIDYDQKQLAAMRKQVIDEARGRFAAIRAFDAISQTTRLPLDEGLAYEQEAFLELLTHPQSLALRYVFFAERMAAHVPGIKVQDHDTTQCVAIIGAGTMGGGIAMAVAQSDIDVVIIDVSEAQIVACKNTIRGNYQQSVQRGRFAQEKVDAWQRRISYATDMALIAKADVVIEAAFENMDVKKDIFRRIDQYAAKNALIATNTSGLDINAIAAVSQRPESILGLHFFSPANIMPLLEIVRAEKTEDTVLARSVSFAKRIRKKPVAVRVCPGFVGNRMLERYIQQAIYLLQLGVSVERIDKALHGFGMAMGPFVMLDMSGLDLVVKREPGGDSLFHALCKHDRMGQKTQKGFYDYQSGSRTPVRSKDAESIMNAWLVEHHGAAYGSNTSIDDEAIVKRCLYALINEAVSILEEGIASRGSDIDMIYVYGYGWPSYLAGPCWYADSIGLEKVYQSIEAFKSKSHAGEHWSVSPLWQTLIHNNKKLSQYVHKS